MSVCVPPDFLWVRSGRRTVLVRRSAEKALTPLLLRMPHAAPDGGVALAGGRGAAYRLAVDGEDVVVRLYRRGGLMACFVREAYWGWTPRPFLELATTEEARRRGVAVPEVLGARVERCWHGWYRGVLVTRYLPRTQTLWECFQQTTDVETRRTISRRVGDVVRALHEGGVYHPDLNLNNWMVRRDGGRVEIFVVDLDRARTMQTALGRTHRQRMLRRLARSARKLDPDGTVIGAADLQALGEACEGLG